MDNENDDGLCALGGAGAVQKDEFNMLLRRINAYHLRPIKRDLAAAAEQHQETSRILNEHLNTCSINQAKIMGGIKVIIWLTSSGIGMYLISGFAKIVGWI